MVIQIPLECVKVSISSDSNSASCLSSSSSPMFSTFTRAPIRFISLAQSFFNRSNSLEILFRQPWKATWLIFYRLCTCRNKPRRQTLEAQQENWNFPKVWKIWVKCSTRAAFGMLGCVSDLFECVSYLFEWVSYLFECVSDLFACLVLSRLSDKQQ